MNPLQSAACLLAIAAATIAVGQSTEITYQGELRLSGAPVNQTADFSVTLWDSVENGGMVAGQSVFGEVPVESGRFTLPLDFGAGAFDGGPRWIEIGVRVPAGSGPFQTLAPRQPVTAAPYALQTRGLHVNDLGRVGINTTDNRGQLNVVGGEPDFTGLLAIVNENLSSTSEACDTYITGWGREYFDNNQAVGRMWALGNDLSGDRDVHFFNQLGAGLGLGTNGRRKDLYVDQAGNVGIGTTAPTVKLEVQGTFRTRAAAGNLLASIDPNGSSGGAFSTFRPDGTRNVFLAATSSGGGAIAVYDVDGSQAGYLGVVSGASVLQADVKNFRVPHPEKAEVDIVYASLEGPEAAMYVRGTATLVDGEATIPLPEHFSVLAADEGITVQLTPLSADTYGLAAVKKSTAEVVVRELAGGAGSFDFDWEVKAVRRAHRDYQPIRAWDDGLVAGDERQQAWDARVASLQRRAQRVAEMEARLAQPHARARDN